MTNMDILRIRAPRASRPLFPFLVALAAGCVPGGVRSNPPVELPVRVVSTREPVRSSRTAGLEGNDAPVPAGEGETGAGAAGADSRGNTPQGNARGVLRDDEDSDRERNGPAFEARIDPRTPFIPDDFATAPMGVRTVTEAHTSILFPVDAKALAKATTDADAVATVARNLPHASSVISAEALDRILTLATRESDESNPLSGEAGAAVHTVSHERWFVVGARVAPCANATDLPTSWLLEGSLPSSPVGVDAPGAGSAPSADVRALEFVCVPQVRVVLQAFGTRREEDPASGVFVPRGASDDKTLHVVFDYLPDFDDSDDATLVRAESAFEDAVVKAAKDGRLDSPAIRASARASYPAPLVAKLIAARRKAAEVVLQVSPSGAKTLEGQLAAVKERPDERTDANRPFARWIAGDLAAAARVRHLTWNLSNSGRAARPGSTWAFGSAVVVPTRTAALLKSSDARAIEAALAPEALTSFAWEESAGSKDALRVSAGYVETFQAVPGRPTSADPDLLRAAGADARVARALSLGGLFPFFQERAGAVVPNDTLETERARGEPGTATETLRSVIGGVFSPARHSSGSTTCASCHATTGARDLHGIQGWPSAAPAGFRDNETRVGFGHSRFNPMWNLRMLGWFERAPSVGDRVVLEARQDAAYARWILAAGGTP